MLPESGSMSGMTAGIQVKPHTCSSKRSVLPESGSMSGMTAGIQVKPHTCSSSVQCYLRVVLCRV